MQIDIITLFPEMFDGPFGASIVRRAIDAGLIKIDIHNLRDWTHDGRRTVDDAPFGGGPGMILKPQPLFEAVDALRSDAAVTVLLTPNGELLKQPLVRELAAAEHLILICGHYEGVDERVADHLANKCISIGDYVLSGGELPAMVIADAIVRLLPGALGCADSTREEAHEGGLLEYPQYTRPAVYRGNPVPEIVRSGNHQQLERWKRRQALRRTADRRPDLMTAEAELELAWLELELARMGVEASG
ncbi:MAG: tRNA (guanine-N1)-methyltransferase [Chloroflexi bacterium]|nr:tRNA (guanine-N1)-methyltransferase [Chloroflexota bacterium]